MSDRIEIGAEDDVPPGDRLVVDVKGVSIGVYNVDGEYHALLNNCPHQNGPLCEGDLSREITAEFQGIGEHLTERYTDRTAVHCPLHGWGFDVKTGEHIGDDSITVPTYDVTVEDGRLYIQP